MSTPRMRSSIAICSAVGFAPSMVKKSLKLAALRALRNRLDPFVLSSRLDGKLRRIHALSNLRYNPGEREKAS